MLNAEEAVEVVPGLRQHEVNEAVRMIISTNWLAEYGLMLAFQEAERPRRKGFALLTQERGKGPTTWLALYAETPSFADPFHLTGTAKSNVGYDAFIVDFLKRASQLMQTSYADFINDFVKHHFLWRFRGYVDGKQGGFADNSSTWRTHWGRVVEIATPGRLNQVGGMSPYVPQLIRCLRHHATEGQIVLDR